MMMYSINKQAMFTAKSCHIDTSYDNSASYPISTGVKQLTLEAD